VTATAAPVTVDTAAAAVAAGVKPFLIRRWAARYPEELPRQGSDGKGRALYLLADVYACAARRPRARRSGPSGA